MQSEGDQAPFKMSDGTTYILSPKGNYTEFGDFMLKLVAEVSGHGASEGYWLCSCETYVYKYLERRKVILPASAFDSRAKFLFCLREQFSSGMFSLNGSVNNRDVADLYSFLKKDYQLGRPQRCQLIKHLGYQGNNYWYISEKIQLYNGNLVAEDQRRYLCLNGDLQLQTMCTEIADVILTSTSEFNVALTRYLSLCSAAFGANADAFMAATSFVLWRILTNARGDSNGDNSSVNSGASSDNPGTSSVNGTIGIFPKEQKAGTDDDKCHMCQDTSPPTARKGKGKIDWIQCTDCQHWFHMVCAGVKRAPRADWFCTTCASTRPVQ